MTTTDEHFGLLGALATSGARIVVVAPDPDAIRAAVTPRTRLLALSQVIWTTGRVLPVRELRDETGIPVLVDGAQSVGAIPVAAAGFDYLTISGQKWLCGPDSTGALVVADPDGPRGSRHRATSRRPSTSRTGSSSRSPVRPASTPAGGPRRRSRACWRRSTAARPGPSTTPPRSPSAAGSSSPTGSRSSARPRTSARRSSPSVPPASRPRSSRRSTTPACTCARSRRPGLIRVSCGWWTSDGDLDRLLAGLPA